MKQQRPILQLILVLMIALFPIALTARDAPITTAGSSGVCPGSALTVPVSVTNFSSIKAVSLRIDYDPTQIHLAGFSNLNPAMAGAIINNVVVSPTLNKIMFAWSSLNTLSLPDGSTFFDLNFTLVSGSPSVSFNNDESGGGDCEYADENGNAMNDIPTDAFYFNAAITNLGVAVAEAINGDTAICAGTQQVSYSVPPVPNATGYAWTVPAGCSIVSGDNSPSIVVDYSTAAVSGDITVAGTNFCGTGLPSSLPVTIYPLPVPELFGLSSVCAGASGNIYSTEPGMTNYQWSVTGGTITAGGGTDIVMVTWDVVGTQFISVNYTNSNLCSATSPTVKSVVVNPLPAPSITGISNLCVGSEGVSYATEPGMTSYLWNVSSGGTITSGNGASNILVTWHTPGNQFVSINYFDLNGCTATGATLKNVIVDPLPSAAGNITGPDSACPGASGIIYSVSVIADAIAYLWTVPSGVIVTSGDSTDQITVTFGTEPLSGVITVKGANLCGNGPVSPEFVITVDSVPAPVVTAAGAVLTSSAVSGNQWYYEETGAIPGATGQVYTAIKTGWYWANVNLNNCASDTSNHVYVLFAGQENSLENASVRIFPIPNDGNFTISIPKPEGRSCIIRIYNPIGEMIADFREENITGTLEKGIKLSNESAGFYTLVIYNGTQKIVTKMLLIK